MTRQLTEHVRYSVLNGKAEDWGRVAISMAQEGRKYDTAAIFSPFADSSHILITFFL